LSEKRLPGTTAPIWPRNTKDIDFDGVEVRHVLDYYFPEWSHKNGRDMILARGFEKPWWFIIGIPSDRSSIIRQSTHLDEKYGKRTEIIKLSSKKIAILSLFRDSDVYDSHTDKRTLEMLKDLRKQK